MLKVNIKKYMPLLYHFGITCLFSCSMLSFIILFKILLDGGIVCVEPNAVILYLELLICSFGLGYGLIALCKYALEIEKIRNKGR